MLIRTLSALQDRSRLSLRIFLYYLVVSVAALIFEHFVIAPATPGNRWAPLAVDSMIRIGIGVLLYMMATRLIRTQETSRTQSIESTLGVLQRLALASEFRDDVTAAHNNRIGHYCELVGRQIGLEEEQCAILRYASTLHDIGKLAIPDRILQKPGPLTDEERDHMRMHVLFGADLLAEGEHPIMVCAYNIALTHHEAWDGTGYPNGLVGTQIPLAGRIVALCDTFDALISDRPYKPAWTIEEAVVEILHLSGKRFDPVLVQAFIRVLPEIRESIRRELPGRGLRDREAYTPAPAVIAANPELWSAHHLEAARISNERSLEKLLMTRSEVGS